MKHYLESLYGVWAAGVVAPTVVASTTLFGSGAVLAGLEHPEVSTFCSRSWGRTLLASNFTQVKVEGAEHIDKQRSYIVMSNHTSYLDAPALLGYLPLPLRFVMKKELGRIPIFGAGVRRQGGILVDRQNREQAVEELRKGIGPLMERRLSLLVFPEGTRSKDGQLGDFKKGGFMTALQTGLPILPVALLGCAQCLPASGWRLRPGRITLRIGSPIDVAAYGMTGRDKLMSDVREAMCHLLESAEPSVPPKP